MPSLGMWIAASHTQFALLCLFVCLYFGFYSKHPGNPDVMGLWTILHIYMDCLCICAHVWVLVWLHPCLYNERTLCLRAWSYRSQFYHWAKWLEYRKKWWLLRKRGRIERGGSLEIWKVLQVYLGDMREWILGVGKLWNTVSCPRPFPS